MPLELYQLWHQYPWQLGSVVCQLKVLIPETSSYASIFTLVTFTLDRYYTICGSHNNTHLSIHIDCTTPNQFIRNIIIIWTLALLGGAPLTLFNKVNYLTSSTGEIILESSWCGLPFTEPDTLWEVIVLASAVIFFFIPICLICFLYYFIAIKINESTRLDIYNNSDTHLTDQRSARKIAKARKNVVKLLGKIIS